MTRILKWIIKKTVTLYWKRTGFYIFSWGVDEHVDLSVTSEEYYDDRYRIGLREEKYPKEGGAEMESEE